MKTLIAFALGSLFSIGTAASASAAGTSAAPPVPVPDAGIEVIVVTAKRPVVQTIAAEQPIVEFVVTAKRAPQVKPARTPPVMAIEMPKVELAVAEPLVVRL